MLKTQVMLFGCDGIVIVIVFVLRRRMEDTPRSPELYMHIRELLATSCACGVYRSKSACATTLPQYIVSCHINRELSPRHYASILHVPRLIRRMVFHMKHVVCSTWISASQLLLCNHRTVWPCMWHRWPLVLHKVSQKGSTCNSISMMSTSLEVCPVWQRHGICRYWQYYPLWI